MSLSGPTEDRLDRLRGGTAPRRHDARTIAALTANPGCPRRALMDAAGVDKQQVAARAGFPVPFGQSEFAITHGNSFEKQVKEDVPQLLTLLREVLDLDVSEAAYSDLNEVEGSQDNALRHRHTRQLLTAEPGQRGTMFDHPLLSLSVAGRNAYLEPDLIAFQVRGQFHVVEIKSFAIVDGRADPAKVAAAAVQSAVYVLALRDLLGSADKVHHETILICPRGFSRQPVATKVDVRRQLSVLTRQLSRITQIEDLLALYPGDLTFDLDPGPDQQPRRPPADLAGAVLQVGASYAPECLSSCELCYLCRDEAQGTTGALGKTVRADLGGIESTAQALDLARGAEPEPEQAEVAVLLRQAARLREQITGQAV
jgi:hypothetical protein